MPTPYSGQTPTVLRKRAGAAGLARWERSARRRDVGESEQPELAAVALDDLDARCGELLANDGGAFGISLP